MKIFKLFLILSVAITISYFSWSYYTSRSLQEKHEKAILVFSHYMKNAELSGLERFLCTL